MPTQTTRLSNRELRELQAKANRSDALNRYLADCQQQADLARQDLYIYCGIAAFFCLVAFSAVAGLSA